MRPQSDEDDKGTESYGEENGGTETKGYVMRIWSERVEQPVRSIKVMYNPSS